MHSMLGHLAELAARELRADLLFMGIGAISVEQGLMNDSVPEILIDRALSRMARSVVVLADASKFEQVEPGFVFGLEEVDILVTDASLAAGTATAIREKGIDVIVAEPDAPAARPASRGSRVSR
jgi:DeoR family fructose operon transcriptional repressor